MLKRHECGSHGQTSESTSPFQLQTQERDSARHSLNPPDETTSCFNIMQQSTRSTKALPSSEYRRRMARGAPPIGLRPRRMTPSMSNAMPKDGLAGADAECEKRCWTRSDGRRRCTVWSSARDRDRAPRTSAKRKPLMLPRRALEVYSSCAQRPSASQRMRGRLAPRRPRPRGVAGWVRAWRGGGGRVLEYMLGSRPHSATPQSLAATDI
jgi:hypothetical protein